MTIRNIVLFGLGVALTGCASMDVATSNSGSVQQAVYVSNGKTTAAVAQNVADGTGTLKPVVSSNGETTVTLVPGQSKPMRLYWFLGGR